MPFVNSGSSSDWYWAYLNPALANSHRLKSTPVNSLCLPDLLISEYAISWAACTDKLLRPGVELRTSGGFVARHWQAMCTAGQWLTTAPWWQAVLNVYLCLFIVIYHCAMMAGCTECLFVSIYTVHCSSLMSIKVIKIWYCYFYFYYFYFLSTTFFYRCEKLN